MSNKLVDLFNNPTAEYRGKPFWSWNGKLEKDELLRQISVMKDMGMGGYFCHSRTGLITEYLGEEWFSLINACADEGERLGLETWLYDEDRWPSGTAGGMVTENPDFRMKYIRLSVFKENDFIWTDNIISAFAVDLDGFSFRNKERIYNSIDAKDKTVLAFTIEEMGKSSFYNGFTYVDTMNEKATEEYIKITHEKYKEKCGDRLGKSIKGIFTDEPHRGAVMCGFCLPNENPEFLTPTTATLFEEFQDHFGYDLLDYLPELFLWENGEKINKVKWKYMELIQQLFLKNFFVPMNIWCKQNNMALTGHVLHEDSLTAQACMIGSVMRAYEYMDIPGVDVLGEHNKNFWIVKQITSAARQLGKKQILSELYGCTGWQMDFESHKAVGDWQALLGANLRCHHLSWYTMEGEAKRDYPASIMHQSAWYKEYKYVEDYYARIHVMMMQGEPICELLVINPIESTWALIYPKWSWYLATLDSDVQKLEERYENVFHLLCSNKIDFDYGDEEMMSRLCKIEKDSSGVYLRVGKAKYRTVLLTGLLTIRSSTLEILKNFKEAGGRVIISGDAPEYVDAEKSNAVDTIAATKIAFEENVLVDEISKNDFVEITDLNNENIKDIYVQIRKNEQDYIVFIMNLNRQEDYNNVSIKLKYSGYLEEWDVRSGKRKGLGYFAEKIAVSKNIPRNGELMFVLSKEDKHLENDTNLKVIEEIQLPKSFAYQLNEPNVCVLDFAKFRIDNGEWNDQEEILKVDIKIREHFGLEHRGGEMIQPWYKGRQEFEKLGKVELQFEFFVKELPEELMLAIETPEHFDMFVNNTKLVVEHEKWWIDKCFKLAQISGTILNIGVNIISVVCDFSENINFEALYLLGKFAVKIDGLNKCLEFMPQQIQMGNVVSQGFPFYGAGISFEVADVPFVSENEKLFIRFEKFDAACVIIKSEHHEKIIAFPPFEEDITELAGKSLKIEFVLTRRNTFGPLHQNPVIAPMYSPMNFVTTGEGFLGNQYGLLPQGMTGKVVFIKKLIFFDKLNTKQH